MTGLRAPHSIAVILLVALAGAVHAATVDVQVVDRSGKGLAGVIVVAQTHTPMPRTEPGTAHIAQQDLQFTPQVLVVQAGTRVSFPNRDTVMHHVYSFSSVKAFEIPLYQATLPPPVEFDQAGVAVIGCNIHDQMLARVLVVDTPYFGTTDATGRVTFEVDERHVASLVAWHPGWGDFGDDRRDYSADIAAEGKIRWTVSHTSAGTHRPGALAWNEDY